MSYAKRCAALRSASSASNSRPGILFPASVLCHGQPSRLPDAIYIPLIHSCGLYVTSDACYIRSSP